MTPFSSAACKQTIFEAVLDARRRHGGGKVILKDPDGTALTCDRLILGSRVLGRKLVARCPSRNPAGIMLPNVAGLVVPL